MDTTKHTNIISFAILITSLFCSPVVLSDSWKKIEGGSVSAKGYQLKCGEGSGWQKCGEEEKGGKFLVLTVASGGSWLAYVTDQPIPKPPLDTVVYCERSSLGVVGQMQVEGVTDYNEMKKRIGFPDIGIGMCPAYDMTFSASDDGISESVSTIVNPINTKAPAVPSNTLICGERDFYTKNNHSYKGKVFQQADRHIFCSKTALAGTRITIPMSPLTKLTTPTKSNRDYIWGAQDRSPRLKSSVSYVTSASKSRTRYRIGEIVYLHNRPDIDSGMSLFDKFTTVYKVTEEKY